MPRPSKPDDQRASVTVGVRMTAADRDLLTRLVGLDRADRLARGLEGDSSASELLRRLLHREAVSKGLLSADTAPSPPSAPAQQPFPPPPTPLPQAANSPLGGLLPPGAVIVIWPPGYPLPIPGAPAFAPPSGPPGPPPATPAAAQPPEATPAEEGLSPNQDQTPHPKDDRLSDNEGGPFSPPLPAPAVIQRRLEQALARTEGLLAKHVAAGAKLSPQDISSFRNHGRLPEPKLARLWAWLARTSFGG